MRNSTADHAYKKPRFDLSCFGSSALNRITGAPVQAHARVAAINLAPVALPNITLPTSALYTQHRDPGHSYLIETDHRFTDYKSYTSSDYLLSRLSMDPSMAQKRLGDGFYEQKLISDQITQLTGRRFVGQYTSTEEQTRALMDSSVGAAQQLKLSTGIALSKEQAAALTQDIVWMIEEQITLADGSSLELDFCWHICWYIQKRKILKLNSGATCSLFFDRHSLRQNVLAANLNGFRRVPVQRQFYIVQAEFHAPVAAPNLNSQCKSIESELTLLILDSTPSRGSVF